MTQVLVASDSFKGSLSSQQVIEAVKEAADRIGKIEVKGIPIADGGEGTLDALLSSIPAERITCQVTDPLGRKIPASFALTPGGTAIIEMATTSGLTLLSSEERDPRYTTSYGFGEIIACALDRSEVKEIIIGIGGSATNDAGIGMGQALGLRALTQQQEEVPLGGGYLHEIESLDRKNLHPRLKEVSIRVMCDVFNPLCGENGASFVYGPQKGADADTVQVLERNLQHIARLMHRDWGMDVLKLPGGGAAGGVGAALVALCGAKLEPGIQVILDLFSFEQQIENVDLIITGEGKTDYQTLFGKAVAGVAQIAKRYNRPVVCISGSLDEELASLYQEGINSFFSLCPGPVTEATAMSQAYPYLVNTAENILRLFQIGREKRL